MILTGACKGDRNGRGVCREKNINICMDRGHIFTMKLMMTRVCFFIYCFFNRNVEKKAEWLRKHKVFKSLGENCRFAPYWIPADAKYVTLHNNISVSSGTSFICHDTINTLISHMDNEMLAGGGVIPPIECLWNSAR